MEYCNYKQWIFATFFFFCLLSSALLFTTATATGKNIFILAGQSNMAGKGGLVNNEWDGIVPPECQNNPNILKFDSTSLWEEAHELLHIDIDVEKPNGIGPGMPFANRVLEKNPGFGVIGLVPCAIGGSALIQWSKGAEQYEMMVMRARDSLSDGGVIRALLWYQGESDEGNFNYGIQFQQFITDIRSDLHLPNLPVIQVALDEAVGDHRFDLVRMAQLTFDFPNVKNVDALGQPLQYDNVHLTTEGQIYVGQMLADAFLVYFTATPATSN